MRTPVSRPERHARGRTIFYFKYVAGDDGPPILFGTLDRSTVLLSTGMLGQILGTVTLGFVVRRVDKKKLAALLSWITGIWLYPLDQKRVDETERDLAARRAIATP